MLPLCDVAWHSNLLTDSVIQLPPDNPDAIKRKFYLKSMPSGFKFKKCTIRRFSSLPGWSQTQ